MITGIEHFGIVCKNTVLMKDFYQKYFGGKVVYDNKKEPPTLFLELADGSMIEFYAGDTDAPAPASNKVQGMRHIALSTDDFENDAKTLIAAGVEVLDAPTTAANGNSTFFFRDPL